MSKTVAAADVTAHLLELLEEAANKQEEFVILQDGKPIGKIVPMKSAEAAREVDEWDERPRKTLEEMRAEGVKTRGDIIEPILEWDMSK
jgi:antitoxin (DNA-binding transcriptional repressor) of toxin-antitoxin stability system